MMLAPGTRLGPYEVLALLGAGGMGEVYRGVDTRLGREVAIKVLPAPFVSDDGRLRRFEQEARAAGLLNHPNILTVHDVGTHAGLPFIVSELVDGLDLRMALVRGPVSSRTAISYARQVARGLAAAHSHGIVHRDLKPENVCVTGEGLVKILDFGLAKLLQPAAAAGTRDGLTLSEQTGAGQVLGTLGYMAPEQVLGQEVDRRADIFALGVILYELLSGKNPFRRETPVESVNAIISAEPDELAAHVPTVSPVVARVVTRCLEKSPGRRFQSAEDLAFALEMVEGAGALMTSGGAISSAPPAPAHRRAPLWAWALAALTLGAFGFTAFRAFGRSPADPVVGPAARFTLEAPTAIGEVSISPNGRQLVFRAAGGARSGLWIRPLDGLQARQLAGTEDGTGPFWAPDGSSVAFFAQRKLKRLDLATGVVTTVCESPDVVSSGAWGSEQTILFAPRWFEGLYRVPASGGTPTRITTPDRARDEVAHVAPAFFPDGRHFLFLALGQKGEHWLCVGSTDGQPATRLVRSESIGLYSKGHLLFARENTLFAQPLDPSTRALSGARRPLVTGIPSNIAGFADMSASQNGVLVYEARPDAVGGTLRWVDRDGRMLGDAWPAGFFAARVSPDGRRAAGIITDPQFGSGEIWLRTLADGASQRFTFDPWNDNFPVWSPDGRRIVFRSDRNGVFNLFEKPADGSATETLLLTTGTDKLPTDWSEDGRFLLFDSLDGETQTDTWVLPMAGDRTPRPFLRTPASEGGAVFSPDGRWVAYESDASGRPEVYVTAFPQAGAQWQVSTDGGADPRWPRNGHEIIYRLGDRVWSVPVTLGAAFQAGRPRALFRVGDAAAGSRWTGLYDVSADARRFLLSVRAEAAARQPFDVLVNWPSALAK